MEKENQLNPKDILKMSDEQWFEFRQKSWLKKREYYSQEMPDYYLKDKERFAQYLQRAMQRRK